MAKLIDDFLALPLWKQVLLFVVVCVLVGFTSAAGRAAWALTERTFLP